MRIFVTGSAGFIGYHLAHLLLGNGHIVHGFDGITDYYDTKLKLERLRLLQAFPGFSFTQGRLEDSNCLEQTASQFKPEVIIHLAAQAGVRHSLEYPRTYIESNVMGTMNILEVARQEKVSHLLLASTSSVYGANESMPFTELQKTDTQLTIYAASKKANESMAHSYAHLWGIPTTVFRFFTVYGPWGRPDMALFKFTKAIINDDPIDIYNHGEMYRDFTFVTDLVDAIELLIHQPPADQSANSPPLSGDSLSAAAPFRVVNIGAGEKVKLTKFIAAIEAALQKTAIKNHLPIQMGDVPATWASTQLLTELTGFKSTVDYREGVKRFVDWYLDYYHSGVRTPTRETLFSETDLQ